MISNMLRVNDSKTEFLIVGSKQQLERVNIPFIYSISQEICTRFLLCCALLRLYIDWFSHIHQAYFTGTNASKATLMNMDKYFMWIHYERLHNHNIAKHNKTVCIFLGIYCMWVRIRSHLWRQCETSVWFLIPTWNWICKSQKSAETPIIISTTSGESENSWARKPRARLYMHLLSARLTTATV